MESFALGGLLIDRFVVGPFGVNTYLVRDSESRQALLIDPGTADPEIVRMLEPFSSDVIRVYLTHCHADHIMGIPGLRARFPIRVACSRGDSPMLRDPDLNLSSLLGFSVDVGPADDLLEDGDTIPLAKTPGKVIAIPGHSPGGLAFCFDEAVFSGDSLFAGSIGRSDFPGCDGELLVRTIKDRLLGLSDRPVFPGHGRETRLSIEKSDNPFLIPEGNR